MDKIDVVLVALNRELLEIAVKDLNFDAVNLVALILDDKTNEEEDEDEQIFMLGDDKMFQLGERQILLKTFQGIKKFIKDNSEAYFLILAYENGIDDVARMKKFLIFNGLPEGRIINFGISSQLSKTWLANLHYVEKYGADFFATGNEYTRDGLNLNYIPRFGTSGGAILADAYQDLRQSYLTAEYIFKCVKAGTIKFVLIGLSPNAFHYSNNRDFTNSAKNFQYTLALDLKANKLDNLLKTLLTDDFKDNFLSTTPDRADLNFAAIKKTLDRKLSIKEIISWEDDSQALTPAPEEKNIQLLKTYIDIYKKNVQFLKDYIKLCLANGAKPIGVVFPFSEIARENYNKELLSFFRETIRQIENEYDFTCIDYFEHLGYDCFYDMTHLNLRGTLLMNGIISMRLNMKNLISAETFIGFNYNYFFILSLIASKNDYNDLMTQIFSEVLNRTRRKDVIKVGFVITDLDQWCGEELYRLFAANKRFKVTVFLCRKQSKSEFALKLFRREVAQLNRNKINVVAVTDRRAAVPFQDLLIFMTPHINILPESFSSKNLMPKTLIAHIPYGFSLTTPEKNYYAMPLFRAVWKMFFSSKFDSALYDKEVLKGAFKGFYSGHIPADFFLKKDNNLDFEWKSAQPAAKKIIYAPHWAINDANNQISTQCSRQFIYEFAKAHPEISWVIKPQQSLFSASKENIFSSAEKYEVYLQKWNELPNAQVCAGAYYQAIFATSDGMIHDGGAFIAEYQFADKHSTRLARRFYRRLTLSMEEILTVSPR